MTSRRKFVKLSATLSVAAVSGCSKVLGSENEVQEITFTEIDSEREMEKPIVSLAEKTRTLIVNGVIDTSNGCMTGEVSSFDYDSSEDILTLEVSEKKEDGKSDSMCTQAITPVSYKVLVRFSESLPKEVDITHKGAESNEYTVKVPKSSSQSNE